MTQKIKALELADQMDAEIRHTVELDMLHHNAAAELRRLHAENELLHERHHFDNGVLKELLQTLKLVFPTLERLKFEYADCAYKSNFVQSRADTARRNYDVVRAAIAKAEQENQP